MRRLSSKGFSAIEGLLLLLIVGMLGFVGWYVYKTNQDATKNTNSSSSTPVTASGPTLSKSYANEFGHFTVNYPASWSLKEEAANDHDQDATLTSPNGTVLHLNADLGGRGGDCPPAPEDKAFQAGNRCYSKEYLSAEKLNIKNVYNSVMHTTAGNIDFTYEPAKLYLATSHFAQPDGTPSYGIGITDTNDNVDLVTKKPEMGLLSDQEWFAVHDKEGHFYPSIYLYATGDSEKFLTSSDAKVIKAIAKTLKVEPKNPLQ